MKPSKPTPDFPLFAHASGKWAKKINGRTRYFGTWGDPESALAEYRRHLNETTKPTTAGLCVKDAVNLFLGSKLAAKDAGLLSPRTYRDYLQTGKLCLEYFGRTTGVESLGPGDFSGYREHLVADDRGIVAVGNEINRARILFKWVADNDYIDRPVKFGPDFRRPSARLLRKHKREQGKKLFTAEQIRLILDECGVQMRAMVLLGINCGYGPTDCATLPMGTVDLSAAWIVYPRPKTEVDRSCPLWPETVLALREALAKRHTPSQGPSDRLFIMPSGAFWDITTNPITKQFSANKLRANIKQGGFYWLRHTFQTIGDGAKDPIAVKHIMGHLDASMSGAYREGIGEDRLLGVVTHVRSWLFGNN